MTIVRALACAVLLLATPRPAPADEVGERANRWFEEGRRLLDAGKLAEACRAFEESQRLDAAAATLLNLGDCYARQGRSASAFGAYRQAVERAAIEGDEPRRALAESRAAAAKQTVSRLVVRPRGAVPVTILRDGAPVPLAQLGTEIPIDPGSHTITVTVPGQPPFTRRLEVRAASTVVVDLPYALDARPAERDWRATAGVGLVAAGAASLAVSGLFGVAAREGGREAQRHCEGGLCDGEGLAASDRAHRAATVSTVLLFGALGLGAGGAYLWWRAGDAPTAPAATVVPVGGGAGVSVRGRF